MTKSTTAKSGMTLVELLIVLALLAGLATFALTSMGALSARSRYEVTAERMKRVDLLLRGDGMTPGRFVADMGRLPTNLCELWISSNNFSAVLYTNEFAGTAVTGILFCGRGGPYLVSNGSNFYDGFGDDFMYANEPVPYLATTGLIGRADWLTRNLSNSYASVTNCVLQVQVYALRNIQTEGAAVWDLVRSTNSVPVYNVSAAVQKDANQIYLYQTNVFVCLQTNHCIAPTGTDWQVAGQHNYPSEAKVILAVPDAGTAIQVSTTSADLTTDNPCTLTGLTPGMRNVMAYGYNNGTFATNKWWSGLQTVEIRPGMNFVKLYLTERIE